MSLHVLDETTMAIHPVGGKQVSGKSVWGAHVWVDGGTLSVTVPAQEREAVGLFVSTNKNVTTAGTALPLLGVQTYVNKLIIKAKLTNTGKVGLGGSGITVATAPIQLYPGDGYEYDIQSVEKLDMNRVYVDSEVNGEGILFTYTAL